MRISLSMLMCVALTWFNTASADIYIGGHADIGVGFHDNHLELHLHAEDPISLYGGGTAGPGEFEPGDIWIGVPGSVDDPGSTLLRPAGSQWNFLAPNEGDRVWFLPAIADDEKPYLGIGTEELLPEDGWNSNVTWTFNSISTMWGDDAEFSIWSFDGVNPVVRASSLVPTGTGNSWEQSTNSHDHFFIGFSGEGVYDVSFTVSAFNSDLNELFSDTGTFRFITGSAISAVPEPSSFAVLGGLGLAAAGWKRRRSRKSLTQA